MRIAAISDLHGYWPEIPDVDVCLIAGDIVQGEQSERLAQYREFGHWLTELVARGIVPIGIAGNHDFELERHPEFARSLPWAYLCDSSITFGGKVFWGTPWTPYFGGWAFNAPLEDREVGEPFLREKYATMPANTDVVLSHGPPAGIRDSVNWGRNRVGSHAFNRRLQDVCPTLAVFGHIHHEYGVEQVGPVTCANVSHSAVRNGQYYPENPPILFEI